MSIEWKSTDSINFQEDTNMSMEWKSTDSIDLAERRAEQIIGPNNFQNPWFLKKGLARLAPVGLIPNNGTGFLISENLIMTNWHIFRDSSWAEDQEFILGFEQNEDGSTPQTQKFKLLPEKFFIQMRS
jgi:endonuclease G